MIEKINSCQTPEELHHIGIDIDMSLAPKEVKIPLYELIEAKMKTLNDIMAEQSLIALSDVEDVFYGE